MRGTTLRGTAHEWRPATVDDGFSRPSGWLVSKCGQMEREDNVQPSRSSDRIYACGGTGTHRDDCPQWVHVAGKKP